jgi:hypothetical protein
MKNIHKLLDISYKKNKNDHDTVFCIVGDEGSSKSTLGLHIHDYWLDLVKREPNIKRIGLDVEGFKVALSRAKKLDIAIFDEAGDGLYSRRTMSAMNVLLTKTFMTIRALNLLTILILPDFFDLDSFFRKRRVRGLFYVYRRGRVMFFNRRQIQQIIDKCEDRKRIYGVSPSLYDTFPKYQGVLKKQYDKLKRDKTKQSQKALMDTSETGLSKTDLLKELLLKGVSVPEACKIAGVSKPHGYTTRKQLGLGKK